MFLPNLNFLAGLNKIRDQLESNPRPHALQATTLSIAPKPSLGGTAMFKHYFIT